MKILWVSLELRPMLIYGFNMKIEIEHFSNISRILYYCWFYLVLGLISQLIQPVIDIFSSNHNVHKSLCGLCFRAPDPFIDKF